MTTIAEKKWTIDDIYAITEAEAKEMSSEHLTIKDHDVYLVDFGGCFGYSALVFADHHHIYYANDYQLHHKGNRWSEIPEKNHAQLRELYIEEMNNKLFTEAELREPIKSYDNYSRKDYFLRNYYGMRRDYISIFFIGSDEARKMRMDRIKAEKKIYNPIALGYFKLADSDFVERHILLFAELSKRRKEADDSFSFLKGAFLHEMWNHEFCINTYQGNFDVLSCFGEIHFDANDKAEAYFDQLNFDDVHRKAFYAARKEYFNEVNKRNLW